MRLSFKFCSILFIFLFVNASFAKEAFIVKQLVDRKVSVRLSSRPATLDWNLAHTPSETYLLNNLMEGLISVGSDLTPKLALATRWERSKDGKTYTFWINEKYKWSDGSPLKAQQFLDSWKRLLSPLTSASYAYLFFDVVGAAEYHKGDLRDFKQVGFSVEKNKITIKLKHPVAHWIYIPTFWPTFPIRKELVSKHGKSWVLPGRLVTIGPFVLDSVEKGKKYVLGPNPHYPLKRGNIAQIDFSCPVE